MKSIITLLIFTVLTISQAENWQCQNDLEIHCDDVSCEITPQGEFTPMDVTFDSSGELSICAYSGCWEGTGDVLSSTNFLVLIGQRFAFSTTPDNSDINGQDLSLTLDKADNIAVLKLGTFVQPLHCEVINKE